MSILFMFGGRRAVCSFRGLFVARFVPRGRLDRSTVRGLAENGRWLAEQGVRKA